MSVVDKSVMPTRYRRRTIVVLIATLLGFVSSAQAAVPSLDLAPATASSSATIADSFGAVLTVAELATQSGKGEWVFSTAAAPTARSQLAALDIYSQTPELANRVLQNQSAAGAFDSSLRYLCSDKIYADLYPNGTGWNNHAYSGCRPGGGLDPDRASTKLTSISLHSAPPPGDGGEFVIIPCGGSIANVSSMTVGSPAMTQASAISISAPSVASLSSFTSLLSGGHH
jgi:hypothetical protein